MNRAAYLSRIGVNESDLTTDGATLRLLQRQHLLTIPFENLDIHWKRPIVLDTDRFYRKIIEEKRGGFCYELNGLFNELLLDLGYTTRLVSARVFNPIKSEYGPEFDHMILVVTVGDAEYIADVGFGDFIAEPLLFAPRVELADREGIFSIEQDDGGSFKILKKTGDGWVPECMFGDQARNLSEFAEMCDFQQYSPDSHFLKGKICSLMTGNGRKTLVDKNFILTTNGKKTETPVRTEEEFDRILRGEFGISKS